MNRATVVNHIKFNAVHQKVSSSSDNEYCSEIADAIYKEIKVRYDVS